VSVFITAGFLTVPVFFLSPEESRARYVMYACAAVLVITPLFLYVSRMREATAYDLFDWLKAVGTTLALVTASLLIDVVLGRLSHPELPLILSMFSTVGVWATLFLVPALLATIYCTINATLLKLF
jgi:hypothetical protein